MVSPEKKDSGFQNGFTDIEKRLLSQGYNEAINVLYDNKTHLGFSASNQKEANYYSVWARDHSITSIGALLTGDKELIKTAKKGLVSLLRAQMDHGQIPSYIEIENRKKVYGGLGAITSVDSNMWVVITCAIMYEKTKDPWFINKTNTFRYAKFYRLFKAFDSNDCGLLEIPKAGDWADIFDRSYHVLFDECLYFQALKALRYLFQNSLRTLAKSDDDKALHDKILRRIRWLDRRIPRVKKQINNKFWLTKDNIEKVRDEYMIFDEVENKNHEFYQSHLMPFKLYWANRFDTFGNLMAVATGISNKARTNKIINYIIKNKVNGPWPIKALHPPVYKHQREWEPIYRLKERPHEYHNGAIWPVITGFWIYVLAKRDYHTVAKEELLRFTRIMKRQKWDFNEWLHGKTSKPKGKHRQAWSAAAYIISYLSVIQDKKLRLFF